MNRFFIFSCILCTCALQSQAQFAVNGMVADSTGTGEAYATLRIYNLADTTKAVRLGTTAEDGSFSQPLPKAGKYVINISSVGKSPLKHDFEITKSMPVANLGTLTISDASTTLGEVEVVAQRPLVKTEIDRISYDIQADEDSKTNTIFEMLKKVPRVTVDGEDNIKVDGSSDFKIFKNGRPNSSWSSNPKEVLKSIPASMIKRIEVITEPGAKYDAEGVSGILNIVTMDNTSMSGVLGSIGGAVNEKGSTNAYTYLTTQAGKLTTTLNYGYNYMAPGNSDSHNETYRNFKDSNNEIFENISAHNHGYIHYGNLESSLDIDTLNLVTLSFGGYYYNFNVDSYTNTHMAAKGSDQQIYGYSTHYYSPQYSYFDFNGKLDYQHLTHRKDEALTFSYLLSTTNQTQKWQTDYDDITGNFPIGYSHKLSDDRLKFYEHTFQFDWTRPFAGGHKLETGAKYILRINNSKTYQTYDQIALNDTTDFHHTTHVGALYSEYSYNSTRWGARAGLRYELARMAASYPDGSQPSFHSTLHDVVPTLSVSYKFNDANTLKLNYASRISRPGISYLNPAVIGDTYNVRQGNPNLKSARSHSINLDYTLMIPKLVLNVSLMHRFSNGLIQSVVTTSDDIVYYTYDNVGKFRRSSLHAYAQWTITPKTQIMINADLGNVRYRNDQLNLTNEKWCFEMFGYVTQQLPWKLRFTASFNRMDWGFSDVYTRYPVRYFYGFSLQRSFLKEDRLTVRLQANNPFSGNYDIAKSQTVNGDVLGYSKSWQHTRSFYFSISYRFGSLKAQVKKTAKTIENDDLQGRK